MNFNGKLNQSHYNNKRIFITLALESMFTVSVFSTLSAMVNALDWEG